MKRFMCVVCAIFMCIGCFAKTIRWHVGDSVYTTTTCNSGDSVTLPTAPAKNGHSFTRWAPYKQIEYLESTGTQWIDTGINNINRRFLAPIIETTFQMTGSGDIDWFGTDSNILNWNIDNNGEGKLYIRYGRGSQSQPVAFITGHDKQDLLFFNPKKLRIGGTNATTPVYVNDVHVANIGTVAPDFYAMGDNIKMGAARTNERKAIAKWYNFKISDENNSVLFDGIPVLDFNGVPCLFDMVTNEFFYNQGTGDFIAGPVVSE